MLFRSERLTLAGVHVVETRLTDLSYAPEIAEVMLRRQQASAVVAARQRIVEGAVGMVRLAVDQIESAKRVCGQCQVAGDCLDFALATNQESGVWGGLTEEERRRRRKGELPVTAASSLA